MVVFTLLSSCQKLPLWPQRVKMAFKLLFFLLHFVCHIFFFLFLIFGTTESKKGNLLGKAFSMANKKESKRRFSMVQFLELKNVYLPPFYVPLTSPFFSAARKAETTPLSLLSLQLYH